MHYFRYGLIIAAASSPIVIRMNPVTITLSLNDSLWKHVAVNSNSLSELSPSVPQGSFSAHILLEQSSQLSICKISYVKSHLQRQKCWYASTYNTTSNKLKTLLIFSTPNNFITLSLYVWLSKLKPSAFLNWLKCCWSQWVLVEMISDL